ncbi:MAG: DUF4267 domain-containing protein, partial [Candidatus Eremiobacteraeota bacterium]|nr:DUF4267 domain-containing protein [Candidatus Eremiobacteraeota bacterium]
ILALLAPMRLARSYGVPVRDAAATAFVRATGARDIILGSIFAVNVYLRDPRMLLVLCIAGLSLSLTDFTIAFLHAGKTIRSEQGAHIGGAIGFIVLIVLLAHDIRP